MTNSTPFLLLVNPSLSTEEYKSFVEHRRIEKGVGNQESPHLGFAYILAVAHQKGVRAHYIDMALEGVSVSALINFIERERPTLVGFSAFTVQIKSVGYIAGKIKERFPQQNICVGGCHATSMPLETLVEFPPLDFVIAGEGEQVVFEALEKLERRQGLEKVPGVVLRDSAVLTRGRMDDLDALPFPRWEAFDLSKYPGVYPHHTARELPMVTSRGCPYQCIFCAGRTLRDKRALRSVDSVIGEIERNMVHFGCQSIAFLDETLVMKVDWAKDLFQKMRDRGISKAVNWSCSTRVSEITPEMLRLMKQAGCYYIYWGMESGDDEMLRTMKKGISVKQIKQAVTWAQAEGIVCVGSFIIGLPGESLDSVKRSVDLAHELDLFSVTFPIAVPFPGTPLRKMALAGEYDLKVLSSNWDDYGKQYPGVMESKHLTMEKMRELQADAYIQHPKKNFREYLLKKGITPWFD